ncbi:MAG: YfcE family phosphodiesterase [Crocinitomicaceae bacterium]|nr:YfcE family phosphodiesterase [Crocinitomicaceae bacterium]
MIKIGLISDTHGHWDDAYVKYFSDCNEIWHAGDIGDISIMDKLNKICPTKGVYGNIDNHIIRTEYPENLFFEIEGMSFWITHIGGKPFKYNKKTYITLKNKKPNVFICGHSHICKVIMDKNIGTLYINPGAAGKVGFHKVRTIIRFVISNGLIKNLEVIELKK